MEKIVLRLPRPVKRRIQRTMKKTRDVQLYNRCRIVLLYSEGYGCDKIAEKVGSVPATAVRVANRFLRSGEEGLLDGRNENGTAKVDLDMLQALAELLGHSPQDFNYLRPTWTQELLAIVLAEITGVQVSDRTVSRMLTSLNARWGRPRPVVNCPVSKSTKNRKLRKIRKMLEDLPAGELAFYADEVDIHLNPKTGPDWMLKGVQKEVLTPGVNRKRYIAGALNAKNGDLIWVSSNRKNSDLFIALIMKLRTMYPKAKKIHLILDNYVIHSSKKTRREIAKLDGAIELHFLPPYSPKYNRIEHLWKQLHANVTRNHRCKNIEELMRNVEKFLKRATPFPGTHASTAKASGRIRRAG